MGHSNKTGFTLIELSIVLVIIGLLVGGVLVGKDLIRAATIRAQVSDLEKFSAATNTFRQKYNYLPGDIPDTESLAYGLPPVNGGTPGQGNGIINDQSNVFIIQYMISEPAAFFVDLSAANLITGSYYADGGWQTFLTGSGTQGHVFPPMRGNASYGVLL